VPTTKTEHRAWSKMDTPATGFTSRMILPASALACDGQLNRFLAAGDECGNAAGAAATGYTRTSG
jgi:hypothetical protein